MIVIHVTYIKGKVATNLKLIVITNKYEENHWYKYQGDIDILRQ